MFFRCKCGRLTNYGLMCVGCRVSSNKNQISSNMDEAFYDLTPGEDYGENEEDEDEYEDVPHD